MPPRPLLIGTRGSPLALWQARHVWALLLEAHGLGEGNVGLSVITTSGDHITTITSFSTNVMTRFGLPRTLPGTD